MTNTRTIPITRYAVLNGRELLGIWDTQDIALSQAHFYEMADYIFTGRLTLCDIIPVKAYIHGGNNGR